MDHFDPVSLKVFIAICEHRSLTEAADREHLTVSAVSKRLSALEAQIGAALLDRGRGGVELTAAGEALLPAARGLLQSMARIQADLSEYARARRGMVRVASTMSAITAQLPFDLAAFTERNKTVKVKLDERIAADVVRSVEEGRADLGVCWEVTGTRELHTVPYRRDHLVVVVAEHHELARRKGLNFSDTLPFERVAVQIAGGSLVQQMQQRLAIANGKSVRTMVQVRSYDTACRIVAAGLAIAIVPHEACRPLIKTFGLKVIPLLETWAVRRFVVCARNLDELSVPARRLLESLASRWHEQAEPEA